MEEAASMHRMASRPGTRPVSPKRSELKRLIMMMVGAIAVLDAGVIGLYYAVHIQDRPVKQQQLFVAVWVVLTLIVVTTMMKRIRQTRRGR
jgi:biotin transporter BioY